LTQDYKAYSFENNIELNAASNFVLTNLLLNKKVFGISDYNILDYRLFTDDTEHEKVNKLSIESSLGAGDCSVISWQTQYCGTPNYSGCRIECDNCGIYCYKTSSSIEICNAPNTINWPSGGIGGVLDVNTTNNGGNNSGIPHFYPCPTISSNIFHGEPISPCPEPGPGSGWAPIEIVGLTYYDDVEPIYIWNYLGDDGTLFYDSETSLQPFFVFDSADNYETLYPRFYDLVKNLKTFVKNNPDVLNALQTWSGFSKQQIINHLTFGRGPQIKVEEMKGRYAWYKKVQNENTLRIRASYVRGLESSFLESTKKGTSFLLAVCILHEYIHFGTNHNNISEGVFDFGYGFERDAFNVLVENTNANEIVIKFSKYF
jgi:hypothetical protein